MTDQELIIDALEQAQRILAEYIEPGRESRRPDFTVGQLLLVLDRKDLALAQERLKARCGLKARGIKSPPLWADGSCHHRPCGPYGAGGSPARRRRCAAAVLSALRDLSGPCEPLEGLVGRQKKGK
jgi:hypothetical protein